MTGTALAVAIMTDETGWHTSRLKRALRARGATGRCIDLADCRFDTTHAPHGLAIPGYGRGLPDAVIVRGIAGGTFEQVTVRLGILHALRELGVPVYNDARAIERSVDKSMTTFLLHRAGIPTPPTWVTESAPFAQRVLMRESARGHDLVIKPLFGSQGKGIARIGANSEGCEPLPALKAYGQLAYLQRLVKPISTPGYDWRVMVIGGKAVTAMRRVSEHWVHNVAQGARCEAAELDEPLATLAERASAALGLDYAGVDLIPCDDNPYGATVIEVNGVAAWRGLQTVTPFDIAGCIVDDLLNRRMALADQASHVKEVA
ncbi:ATP-grasp domain-containing protein [Paraburkholderia hospita]|uniref:Alpha-L-glutamate ligase n=1 Tax=Paraburkholderia hospita TaxID=169430 RepID=A0AAN1ML03_9BURK|nr:RimK family alpha-L-glutamate ligase [Paraburkholderia hospita]AUT70973.1 RimK family alpha-L-glutamate ligase [Paraburkholderia hospita]EIM98352.1 alpha-L-glutamate ligase [Paraburkholderia hospita]OUL71845.1 RimK family alpha-L-glutamate ligase [Paraburkholderia hospita]OUL77286.1 RimK family alpha-L-glutamate ligase [Paraburkholderia hospita]SEI09431.1 SSU ribosomal protein S6P modification protein [Paraburkholderia hospita]